VPEYDSKASIMRRPRATTGCCAVEKKHRKIILKCNFIEAQKCGRTKGLMAEMRDQSLLM